MMNAVIRATATSVPADVVTNDDFARDHPDWDMERMLGRTGVEQRHIARSDETSADLGFRAASALIADLDLDPSTIDALVVCSQTHDYVMPGNAALLHGGLGLRDDVMAFDLTLACSGFVYGLGIIDGLLASGLAHRALFVTGDTYSKLLADDDRATRTLFGDGAAASLIEPVGPGLRLVDAAYGTSGSQFDRFIVWSGACRSGRPDWVGGSSRLAGDVPVDRTEISMDGMGMLSFVTSTVPRAVTAMLERNGLTVPDVSHFMFHQASLLALQAVQRALSIPDDVMTIDFADTGNLVSASIPFLLARAQARDAFEPGQRVLVAGFGVGLSWGVALLEVVGESADA